MKEKRRPPRRPVLARMVEKIDFSGGPDGCWVWAGARDTRDYGKIVRNGRVEKAHRVMWEEMNGPIPPGLFGCHHCDNPPCVNPAHLFLGTHAENMADMMRKGRYPTGSAHHNTKLTAKGKEIAVLMLQSGCFKQTEIARRLNVSDATICLIKKAYLKDNAERLQERVEQ